MDDLEVFMAEFRRRGLTFHFTLFPFCHEDEKAEAETDPQQGDGTDHTDHSGMPGALDPFPACGQIACKGGPGNCYHAGSNRNACLPASYPPKT